MSRWSWNPSSSPSGLELENHLGLADQAQLVAGCLFNRGRVVLQLFHFGAQALDLERELRGLFFHPSRFCPKTI